MNVISRKKIEAFCDTHPEARQSMDRWYKIVKKSKFGSFQEVKHLFPSADKVKNFVVFNIGGNKFRLIAYIRYRKGRLFIRHILTHEKYDKEKWKEDEWFNTMKK